MLKILYYHNKGFIEYFKKRTLTRIYITLSYNSRLTWHVLKALHLKDRFLQFFFLTHRRSVMSASNHSSRCRSSWDVMSNDLASSSKILPSKVMWKLVDSPARFLHIELIGKKERRMILLSIIRNLFFSYKCKKRFGETTTVCSWDISFRNKNIENYWVEVYLSAFCQLSKFTNE